MFLFSHMIKGCFHAIHDDYTYFFVISAVVFMKLTVILTKNYKLSNSDIK